MAQKGMDFRHKEVINITDGKRLGYVQDVCADLTSGSITSIIVPGSNKTFGFLSPSKLSFSVELGGDAAVAVKVEKC